MGRTVNQISSEELRRYNPKRTMEDYQKDPKVAGRRLLAWKMARIASKILKEKYGAKKVVLFGSLAMKKGSPPVRMWTCPCQACLLNTIIKPPGKYWIWD